MAGLSCGDIFHAVTNYHATADGRAAITPKSPSSNLTFLTPRHPRHFPIYLFDGNYCFEAQPAVSDMNGFIGCAYYCFTSAGL
jgi:hypothetical protein